jgi:hypothetical protein
MSVAQLRKLIREILLEASVPADELAAFYQDSSDWGLKEITLYSPAALERNMEEIEAAVVGYIYAQKPKDPCAGAWEVKMAGGRGYGGILYPAMFAAVNGPLMPDRHSTSPDAVSGWSKQASRKKIPLDNSSVGAERKSTPDDASDDCEVRSWTQDPKTGRWEGDPLIDNAYSPKGNERAILEKLLNNHEKFMKKIESTGVDVTDFLAELSRSGVKRFESERLK